VEKKPGTRWEVDVLSGTLQIGIDGEDKHKTEKNGGVF